MAAITITDLNNGKLDVDLIQKLATSAELEATDRLGNTKKTWAGIEQDLGAAYAITTTGANRIASEAAASSAVAAAESIGSFTTLALASAALSASLIPLNKGIYVTADTVDAVANNGFWVNRAGVLVRESVATLPAVSAKQGLIDAQTLTYLPGKNLYNPANKDVGRYVAVGGTIQTAVGWSNSGPISVTSGQTLTVWANAAKRVGLAFFASATATTAVSGTYATGDDGLNPVTLLVPAGATHFRFNIKSDVVPEPSQIQAELGYVKTAYEAWHQPNPNVRKAMVFPAIDDGPRPYEQVTPSKNLFNTATVRVGKFVSSGNGTIQTAAGWGCSDFIPVTPLQQVTVSGARGRDGVSFFASAVDSDVVVGSYFGGALPLTRTVPASAAFMVINLYQPSAGTYSDVQVEVGPNATGYVPFGDRSTVDRGAIYPPLPSPGSEAANVELNPSVGTGSIVLPLGDEELNVALLPFRTGTHNQSSAFNFSSESLGGAGGVLFRMAPDDIAPVRVFGATVDANHGYAKTSGAAVAHGKTQVDVGSVWTDGTTQWVLVEVPSVDSLAITQRTGNSAYTTGTLTHVSGATHTESFSLTLDANSQGQWYPVYKNRVAGVAVDGVQVSQAQASYPFKRVSFYESREVMNKSSIVEWLITQVGTATDIAQYDGTADVSMAYNHTFDPYGGCVIAAEAAVLNNVATFQDIMFTQAARMLDGVMGVVRYLVPKALPFTHLSVPYDFAKPTVMTGFNIASRIDFNSTRCDPSGQLCDRVIQFNDKVVLAVGYLPVLDADPVVRRTNAARKALQIAESGKIYMSAIDSAARTTLAAGESFAVVAYRVWSRVSPNRTAGYVVRSKYGDYLYLDWHIDIVDRFPLPPDLHGRPFAVVEKSSNVTVQSKAATNSIVFNVAAAGSAGYAVLRF